ncbi:MAG: hypothetical protein OEW67_11080 [Cyclobacteriaceae bacterium]|nr:hypothetical protein [Cyclobacteriaceae bacterium]
MKRTFVFLSTVLLLFSCNRNTSQQKVREYFPIDSLIQEQIDYLYKNEASLMKSDNDSVSVKGKKLDSKGWKQELGIFESIDINKSSLVDGYNSGVYDDPVSNLDILKYSALEEKLQVQEMNIYYLKSLDDIKKIVAHVVNTNSVYHSSKTLSMEFEKHNGLTVLKKYSIIGNQKLATRDSILFSIIGNISL